MGGFGPSRPRYEQNNNNYNPRGNDHPGYRMSDPAGGLNQHQYQNSNQYRAPYPPKPQGPSTEEMLQSLTQHFTTHVQTTESSIKSLEKQVGQLAEAFSNLAQQNSRNLPSQTERNPRENISAVYLRSGRSLEGSREEERLQRESGQLSRPRLTCHDRDSASEDNVTTETYSHDRDKMSRSRRR